MRLLWNEACTYSLWLLHRTEGIHDSSCLPKILIGSLACGTRDQDGEMFSTVFYGQQVRPARQPNMAFTELTFPSPWQDKYSETTLCIELLLEAVICGLPVSLNKSGHSLWPLSVFTYKAATDWEVSVCPFSVISRHGVRARCALLGPRVWLAVARGKVWFIIYF